MESISLAEKVPNLLWGLAVELALALLASAALVGHGLDPEFGQGFLLDDLLGWDLNTSLGCQGLGRFTSSQSNEFCEQNNCFNCSFFHFEVLWTSKINVR